MPEQNEPATIEVRELDANDQQLAAVAGSRLSGMSSLAVVIGIGLALGGWYMNSRGQTSDAVACGVGAAIMLACVIGLKRAQFRDTQLGTKDVITGVVRSHNRVETKYNFFYYLNVGGVEVAVPEAVFDRVQVGQKVAIERLTGSRQFLRIKTTDKQAPDSRGET